MSCRVWPIVVVLAIVQHLVWATMLLLSPDTFGVTSIRGLNDLLGSTHVAVVVLLFVVAYLAIWSFLVAPRSLSRVVLMLPQQFVLYVSAGGAVVCMATGTFSDGTVRSIPFLIMDQLPALLFALGHTAAIGQVVIEDMT